MPAVTMTLTDESARKLREKAARAGLELESYLIRLIERDADMGSPMDQQTFDAIVAPVREAFKESGMTDSELIELVQSERDEIRREKRARQAS